MALCGASLLGCSNEVSVDEKFVNLYVELRLVDINYGKDSPMGRLVRRNTLKAAGYTREQFIAKADEILDDERMWVPFQKAVTARLDSLLVEPKPQDTAPAQEKPAEKAPQQPAMPAHKGGVH